MALQGQAVFFIDKTSPGYAKLHIKIHAKINSGEDFSIKDGDQFVVQFNNRIPLSSVKKTNLLSIESTATDSESPGEYNEVRKEKKRIGTGTASLLTTPSLFENRPPRKRKLNSLNQTTGKHAKKTQTKL